MPDIITMVSRRASASRGVLAWSVDSEPSWPVFMACSMSSASPPRTSPTTMRSGRIRSEFRTSSRMGIWPLPSTLGGRASSRMTCRWRSCSSTASSMVTMRSSVGMYDDTTLSSVVLPVPVPPLIRMLRLPRTQTSRKSAACWLSVPSRTRSADVNGVAGELPDGQHGSVDRQRRDDGVDPGAVGQSGIDQRRRLVDPAADGRDDAFDDLAKMVYGEEP